MVHAPLTTRSRGPADRYVLAGAKDRHEHDAHRIARHFTASASGAGTAAARPHVRPAEGPAFDGAAVAPPSVHRVLGEPGDPLEPAARKHFEQHFGHDFSGVRVHSGPAAARSAHEVGARAYTAGRDMVFGAGQYAPGTPAGRHVLAHELTHVVQQDGAAGGQAVVPVQRLSFSDVLETGTGVVAGPGAAAAVHLQKQFIDDLAASVRESPQHFMEFFTGELYEQIKAHLVRIVAVTAGLILAEELVAVLTALPEPTLLSKVAAAILEIAIIAVLGYFAAVELGGAYEEGRRWLAAARRAKGQPEVISEASRSFVRMVWHIFLAVLAVAGVRARLKGLGGAGAGAGADASAGGEGGTAPGSAGGGPGAAPSNVIPFRGRPPAGPPGEPPLASRSAFGEGSTARQLAPAEAPQVSPPDPVPAPKPASVSARAAAPSAAAKPGVQPLPAVAAGLASADDPKRKKRPPFVLRLPQEKAPHLATYRAWLGRLQSDPNYERGSPAQLDKWHQAHRLGGSHPIPREVLERGHRLGLTGEAGEELIRVPNWSRTRRIPMEVDHIVELQVTPAPMRDAFDNVFNYELLDRPSNGQAGNLLRQNIAAERKIQVAFDPSAAGRVLIFDRVEMDGGQRGERWSSDDLVQGKQLDAYRRASR